MVAAHPRQWNCLSITSSTRALGRPVLSALGHKPDIVARQVYVYITPKSGHWNRHVYYLRRNNSGSLAMLAAIRRARRSFHRRLSTRGCGASLFEVGALELAIQMPW